MQNATRAPEARLHRLPRHLARRLALVPGSDFIANRDVLD
jgi:hypothetical protein